MISWVVLCSVLALPNWHLPQVKIDGVTWLWTPGEDPAAGKWRVDPERARLLAQQVEFVLQSLRLDGGGGRLALGALATHRD